MRFIGIAFLLCVSIGTVSPFFLDSFKWPPWDTSIFTDLLSKINNGVCSYFSAHPDRAAITINKINETLYKTNQTAQIFAQTLAYLNVPANQAELTGGTNTCSTFFNGLKDQLVADWKNQNFNSNDAQQKALNTLQDLYNTLKSSIN